MSVLMIDILIINVYIIMIMFYYYICSVNKFKHTLLLTYFINFMNFNNVIHITYHVELLNNVQNIII